jgi:threonine dehydratase
MNRLGLKDIEIAHQRIAPHIARTPLLHSPELGSRAGFPLWVKAENNQITGSFKLRGALNKALL